MKQRLDKLLVERGLFETRERARAAIMSGIVFVGDRRADKPGTEYQSDAQVELRGAPLRYASRGGLKLEKAVSAFALELCGLVAADVGASTGGFTDCMLQNGVARVYAIDVGYGQLAWKLRNDERVVVMERTNIRNVSSLPELLDFATVDVSFISLALVLPCVRALLRDGARLVALVKPQFEAGREKVGKKGVVRDPCVHVEVLQKFVKDAVGAGFSVLTLDYSPITGPEGNIEFIALLSACQEGKVESPPPDWVAGLVDAAHAELKGEDI